MRRLIHIYLSSILIIANYSVGITQTPSSANVIYLLDVSRSMNNEGLFDNIKTRLKELVSESNEGDRVIIGTFSEEIMWPVQVDISSVHDKNDVKNVIDNLKAEGNWTWLSQALKETKEKAIDLRSRVSEKSLRIYILTDCLNDPPPRIKKIEPPMTFTEVLQKYFDGFREEDMNIYLLAYRSLSNKEKEDIKGIVQPIEPNLGSAIPIILINYSGFNFNEIKVSREAKTVNGEIIIEDFQDVGTGSRIFLAAPDQYIINPNTVIANQKGQSEKINITIPQDLSPGNYEEKIQLRSSEATIDPSQLIYTFTIPEQKDYSYLKILLPILFFLLLYFTWEALLREKTIWVKINGEEKPEDIELKGWRVFFLGEKPRVRFISFGLPNHYLQRSAFNNTIYITDENGIRTELTYFDSNSFTDISGNKITLQFYDSEPSDKEPEEPSGPPDIPPPINW